ncbi:hypothetical protein BO83DRAFT_193083 [Aspergillus eucalypticola CBS 122712]|uniref:Uncharacterized protein n=1 Tax=Aspergillus eucalypticola (strain CBS 122712 / IBT 29274) TaxID=1448314 RepID=A0A317UL85_ASPEC|nr:uncharacterized protein BO83DRAFT_193083 [Aspergillus eucalypticola CBS 122712]PWY62139.1 hypothetical protein BO83DRAFT_193083 [Aspergillus eucalypticola CBS 122712]
MLFFLSCITSVSSAYSSPGGLCSFNTVIDCFDGRRCGHANASEHVGGNKQLMITFPLLSRRLYRNPSLIERHHISQAAIHRLSASKASRLPLGLLIHEFVITIPPPTGWSNLPVSHR